MTQQFMAREADPAQGSTPEPIAIIGMGCRFPGVAGANADSPAVFWQLLCDGVDMIREIPPDRWDPQAFYSPDGSGPGKINSRWGGFIEQIDHFDAQFFGISPREATRMDPQHRLLLEVAWEALEDGGQVVEHLAGAAVGVFVGISTHDYYDIQVGIRDRNSINAYTNLGGWHCIAANRISHAFDLRGPSMSIDTACSSSLVAMHQACNSLWQRECSMALVGGVNAVLKPELNIGLSKASMLSPDGRCKSFDASANGYVRGEGAGVVVLKPLSQAVADGDHIYATILGSATNQDGRTNGITVPSQTAQEAMLRAAYQRASIDPRQVSYVEAHGTGTPVGDPIEAKALGTVLGQGRAADQPCLIGSVKSNMGHLEPGSGIAGIIKTALALQHRLVPPNLHFHQPNPNIPFAELGLRVPQTLESFSEGAAPLVAGVNSFGFGGANAHIILGEAPTPRPPTSIEKGSAGSESALLLPLSARHPHALKALATAYRDRLCEPAHEPAVALPDLLHTASQRRSHHEQRLAITGRTTTEFVAHLDAFLADEKRAGIEVGRAPAQPPQLVFVFSGMGPQWWGMGRQLLATEPVFRAALEECDAYFTQLAGWSLLAEFQVDEVASRMHETEVAQPANFALQVALHALWRHWGITPDLIVGHSAGEAAAAYAADMLNLEEAVRVIYHRSRLQQRTTGSGKMAAIGLSATEAQSLLAEHGESVSIAAVNSPSGVTISGAADAIDAIARVLAERNVFCRLLRVTVPYHSPKMDPLQAELLDSLRALDVRPPATPIYSTVTGRLCTSADFDAAYWWRNVRQPVYFADAIQNIAMAGLAAEVEQLFVELSPHPVLAQSIGECLQSQQQTGEVLPSLRRQEDESARMMQSLGGLYTKGFAPTWANIEPEQGGFVRLPTYPWQHERYWNESAFSLQDRQQPPAHPLLGPRTPSAMPTWQADLSLQALDYLRDHAIQGAVVFPAAGYVEMALTATHAVSAAAPVGQEATEREGTDPQKIALEETARKETILEEVEFHQPLFLSDQEEQAVQLVVTPADTDANSGRSFQIYGAMVYGASVYGTKVYGAKVYGAKEADNGAWTLHASGKMRQVVETRQTEPIALEELRTRCRETMDADEYYRFLHELGLHYGPHFQAIEALWLGENEAVAQLQLPAKLVADLDEYALHPSLLDACLQTAMGALPPTARMRGLALPQRIAQVRVHGKAGARLLVHARLRHNDATALTSDIDLFDESGRRVAEVRGYRARYLNATEVPSGAVLDDLFYAYTWQRAEAGRLGDLAAGRRDDEQAATWLIYADGQDVARKLAKQLHAAGKQPLLVTPGAIYQQLAENHFQIRPQAPEDIQRLLDVVAQTLPPCRGILHLWSLDAVEVHSPESNVQSPAARPQDVGRWTVGAGLLTGCVSVTYLVQALTQLQWDVLPQLWLITAGAQAVSEQAVPHESPVSVEQAPLWGMGRVLMNEHPELNCRLIDLSSTPTAEDVQTLFQELEISQIAVDQPYEEEIALRGGERFVHRLVRRAVQHQPVSAQVGRDGFHLEAMQPGVLDSLVLRMAGRRPPAAGEVEVQVHAAGINFKDVMKAMDLISDTVLQGSFSGRALGSECSGTIVAVGADVTGFAVGDEVIAVAQASLGGFVTTRANAVVHKPPHLSFAEAATLPIAFLTASYALHDLGRLQAGERVLIHTATGGVGLAAVQLAQQAGAEIFATAGSPEKRAYLQKLGVQHVMDSRTLAFADEIMEITGGQGVDVVLNSLTGDALLKSLSVLAPYGRFLELGKRDIDANTQLGLRPFQNNLAFYSIDLDRLFHDRPQRAGAMLRDLVQIVNERKLQPLPQHVFSLTKAAEAFQLMANAQHMGKIVLTAPEREFTVAPARDASPLIRADGVYLITGGLSGFGLAVAEWLVAQGARHLVLVGRRGAATPGAQVALDRLHTAGAQVKVAQADVTQPDQVAALLTEIRQSLPPLRGVIHGAMVLDDGFVRNLDQARLEKVLAPKVLGAWHLHSQTLDAPLDFFVCFSSAVALYGNLGQANYAAANAFLDALAHHRHAHGLPALTINWGALGDVGVLTRHDDVEGLLTQQGMHSLTLDQSLAVLGCLLQQKPVQMSAAHVDWAQWAHVFADAAVSPRFRDLVDAATAAQAATAPEPAGETLPVQLRGLPPAERQSRLVAHLCEQVAHVLGAAADQIDLARSFPQMGLDSMMSVELGSRVKSSLGVDVPVMKFFTDLNISELATLISEQMGARHTGNGVPKMGNGSAPATVKTVETIDIEESTDQSRTEVIEGVL